MRIFHIDEEPDPFANRLRWLFARVMWSLTKHRTGRGLFRRSEWTGKAPLWMPACCQWCGWTGPLCWLDLDESEGVNECPLCHCQAIEYHDS